MKCQILFFWKNKKNIINLSSAENAQRVVKMYIYIDNFTVHFLCKLSDDALCHTCEYSGIYMYT